MLSCCFDLLSRARHLPPRWLYAGLALALAASGASAGTVGAATPQVQRQLDALESSGAADTKLVQIRQLSQSTGERVIPRVIALPELTGLKAAQLPAAGPGQPQQIGVAREVPQAADTAATAALLSWVTSADGRQRAAISVQAPGARGLRLGLLIEQLPPHTQLRVYAPGNGQTTEIAGMEVLRTIQRNLDGGASGADAYTYWLPTVEGAEAALEIELPADTSPALLKVALPLVSHLKMLPAEAAESMTKAAQACNIDVMCVAEVQTTMLAIAWMNYVENGRGYMCSGTLMNNTRQDYIPYFLSANHCISTQQVASSLETYWNYRSSSCNSTQQPAKQYLGGGATLLYSSAATDTSFMRLNASPPSPSVFAGWDATSVASVGASVFSIHHPAGDAQKYSLGAVAGFEKCDPPTADGKVSCYVYTTPTNNQFYYVLWSRGTTEGGSSGGPLFSSNSRVIGQLFAGSETAACTNSRATYGRFDLAFDAALSKWLSPSDNGGGGGNPPPGTLSPVYRFYNTATNAHFYTISQAERDYVIATLKTFQYEGPVYNAYSSQAAGTSALYRFYNTQSGVHFYTISAAERDFVLAVLPTYQYEGPAWYAQPTAGNGTSAVYRFYSSVRNAHFYTISQAERDYVISLIPDFNYEGPVFYAWPIQ